MATVTPGGEVLGSTIEGIDLSKPLSDGDLGVILGAMARYGVVCFPRQKLEPVHLKAFASRFGTLEINVASAYQDATYPEVMTLSNMKKDGRPIGLADAGQDWHTDMSYSDTIAFSNVLHALKVPRRNGLPLGDTLFADMGAAYQDLAADLKARLQNMTVLHDFTKFWDKMRAQPGSKRPPLSEEQRRQKPPVSHPIFLKHPISGDTVLYANPGYAIRINELSERESAAILDMLFDHQVQAKYQYAHHWTEGDVLMWDNIRTLHNARPDYGPDEHRLIIRCQVMADRVFDPAFAKQAKLPPASAARLH